MSTSTESRPPRVHSEREKAIDEVRPQSQQDIDLEKGDESKGTGNNLTDENPHADSNLVTWDGPNDPENPQNFKEGRKWLIAFTYGVITFCATFASSVFSAATKQTSEIYRVSTTVTTLGTALFVIGFALGPIFFGPFSELYGRKVPLFFGFVLFCIFQIPVAVALNLETIMLGRFFGGVFGVAPLAIGGGALADIFDPVNRGVAAAIFAGASFLGPIAGPIVGGFIVDSHLGWRWTSWITLIISVFFGIIGWIIIPETCAPILLQARAKRLRYETQNWAIHSLADETKIDFRAICERYLLRPFIMLALEPILILITIYMSLIYGILYLFFETYPIVFQEQRGWNNGVGSLPFIGISIGVLLGCGTITVITKTRFARKLKEHGKVIPEERLVPMMLGAFLLPIGLFWFAWTSNPHISWVPSVLAGVPIGWGIIMIFLQGLNYIIDVYKMNANSGIAANTLVRSLAGGGFPLFASAMFHSLGVPWATSLLAFLCVALIPVPICFFIWGEKLRTWSRYSPTF